MNALANSNVTAFDALSRNFSQLTTFHDKKHALAWCYMHAEPRSCFTPQLLEELNGWCTLLNQTADKVGVKYHVIASQVPGVFNLGGDLNLFAALAERRDRNGLLQYGKACIDALHSNLVHFGRDITTISLVQGSALGGGFETALSSDVIIAERGSRMGFPEILFNLFPGMGALNLLARRTSLNQAERLVASGENYTAEQLHEMGIVDIVVDDGEGMHAVRDYILRHDRSRNGLLGIRHARERLQPIERDELLDICAIWVDTALRVSSRDLRTMQRVAAAQLRRVGQAPSAVTNLVRASAG